MAGAAQQVSGSIRSVAAATEELDASIGEISRQVSQAAEVSHRAVGEAEVTSGSVRGLSQAADRIGEVGTLIAAIASQTNLLALNATIEAARAGEAGKGFAVVAQEVKNLANQTAKAIEDIDTQVSAIRTETQVAVQAIATIRSTIGSVSSVNTVIASAVGQQASATRDIARNVQEAAAGTGQVETVVSGVRTAADSAGASARDVLSTVSDLVHQTDRLWEEMGRFVTRVRSA
jgi:methyl-accepting chemotaxis protein